MKIVLSARYPQTSLGPPPRVGRFARLRPSPTLTLHNEKMWDGIVRRVAVELNEGPVKIESTPICKHQIPDATDLRSETVLQVSLEAMPLPDDTSSWQDIFNFKEEMHDKQWAFRRFLNSLATKTQTEAEVRDDIEWTINEYTNAMKLHNLKAGNSFMEVYVIPVIEVIEDLAKFDWSKVAKGALSANKRRIELMEAEMKAPGRECAYVFEVRKRFGTKIAGTPGSRICHE